MNGRPAPLFSEEGPQFYGPAFAHNQPFATGGSYTTQLSPAEEQQFRAWLNQTGNPSRFDPNARIADYDMRGYWRDIASRGQNRSAINPTDNRLHFPDTYKTPYDTTFSGESKYAQPGTPFAWMGNDLIDQRTGQTIFGRATGDPSTLELPQQTNAAMVRRLLARFLTRMSQFSPPAMMAHGIAHYAIDPAMAGVYQIAGQAQEKAEDLLRPVLGGPAAQGLAEGGSNVIRAMPFTALTANPELGAADLETLGLVKRAPATTELPAGSGATQMRIGPPVQPDTYPIMSSAAPTEPLWGYPFGNYARGTGHVGPLARYPSFIRDTGDLPYATGDLREGLGPATIPQPQFAGAQFHGSQYPVGELSNYTYNPENLYSPTGLFTTNDLGMSRTYAGLTPEELEEYVPEGQRVYHAAPKPGLKLLDLEKPMPKWMRDHISQIPDEKNMEGFPEYAQNIETQAAGVLNQNPEDVSVREFMDQLRGVSSTHNSGRYLLNLEQLAKQQGYQGYRHLGGAISGGPYHEVQIFFDPATNLSGFKPLGRWRLK